MLPNGTYVTSDRRRLNNATPLPNEIAEGAYLEEATSMEINSRGMQSNKAIDKDAGSKNESKTGAKSEFSFNYVEQ